MMRAGMQKQSEHLELMKKYRQNSIIIIIFLLLIFDFSIKSFEQLREDVLSKIADTLDEISYADQEYIVRQGAKGDTFYIVSKGRAQITEGKSKWETPAYVRHLERGDSFGELALQS